jgi:lipoyl(octanoyl) transferase
MNVTPEPTAWFDLVTACGLDDVRAVSLHDLIRRLPSTAPSSAPLPSVADVAAALVPRFADTFQREFLPLSDGSGAEVDKIREIVLDVEHQAEKALREAGSWPTRPNVTVEQVKAQ